MALRSLALCAGIGGLDLGVKLARPDHRLVGVVERQAYCASVLVARMADASLDQAPIWDDLSTFDGRVWCGVVDLVTAGYPCQPESVAGLRAGVDDERWLWPEVWRVIREVGPEFVFLENVPGHLSGTFGRVLGDMATLGWRVEWDCVPAAAVGAPHLRDRLFVLAANPDGSYQRDASKPIARRECDGKTAAHDDGGNGQAADAASVGGSRTGKHGPSSIARRNRARRHAADSASSRLQGPGLRGPVAEPAWGDVTSAPEPTFRRVDDGPAHWLDRDWADRIHALGNGVVPQAAAKAWRTLEGRMTLSTTPTSEQSE